MRISVLASLAHCNFALNAPTDTASTCNGCACAYKGSQQGACWSAVVALAPFLFAFAVLDLLILPAFGPLRAPLSGWRLAYSGAAPALRAGAEHDHNAGLWVERRALAVRVDELQVALDEAHLGLVQHALVVDGRVRGRVDQQHHRLPRRAVRPLVVRLPHPTRHVLLYDGLQKVAAPHGMARPSGAPGQFGGHGSQLKANSSSSARNSSGGVRHLSDSLGGMGGARAGHPPGAPRQSNVLWERGPSRFDSDVSARRVATRARRWERSMPHRPQKTLRLAASTRREVVKNQ